MNENKPLHPLLTAKELATILNIPLSTLRKNVSFNPESLPKPLKLGKARNSPVRWRLQDIEAWLEQQSSNA